MFSDEDDREPDRFKADREVTGDDGSDAPAMMADKTDVEVVIEVDAAPPSPDDDVGTQLDKEFVLFVVALLTEGVVLLANAKLFIVFKL